MPAAPATERAAAFARKARFWDRIAHKYAADPIADPAGYEATLKRVQSLLSVEYDVLESAAVPAPSLCVWHPSPAVCERPMCRTK